MSSRETEDDGLITLYESEAAFAAQPGDLARGMPGVRQSLTAFINMKGTLDLEVTRVLEAGGLALVRGFWSFTGSGPDGTPVTHSRTGRGVLTADTLEALNSRRESRGVARRVCWPDCSERVGRGNGWGVRGDARPQSRFPEVQPDQQPAG